MVSAVGDGQLNVLRHPCPGVFQSLTLACLSPWYVQQLQKHLHFSVRLCLSCQHQGATHAFFPGQNTFPWSTSALLSAHRHRTFSFGLQLQRHGLNPACQACAMCWKWEHISCPASSGAVSGWCEYQVSRLQLSWGFWGKCTVTSAGGSTSVPWEWHFLCRA